MIEVGHKLHPNKMRTREGSEGSEGPRPNATIDFSPDKLLDIRDGSLLGDQKGMR